MKVLIACEYSGRVRDAFIEKGHDAMSCDLLPTERPGPHIQGDVIPLLKKPWDLIIAHPPCTYLTNAGVRWLMSDAKRWVALYEACRFFNLFLESDCPRVCVENPVPHKYALAQLSQSYSQTIQPWQFGHTESKRTCLWLKGLPLLKETCNVKEKMSGLPKKETDKVHYCSPGPDRWKERSRTYDGIASAMADQWGAWSDCLGNIKKAERSSDA